MKLSYLILLLAIFVSSCSTTDTVVVEQKKSYSEETLNFFNRIEKTKSNNFNNHQQTQRRNDDLDEHDSLESIVIESPSFSRPPSTPSVPRPRKVVRRKKAPETRMMPVNIPQKNIALSDSSNESLIEIQQHVSYYCMDSKNLSKFDNSESQCENFGQNVLESCKKISGAINKQTVNCVLKKLKNG